MKKGTLKPQKINHYHIITRRDICGGRPIIKGTRTSVDNIAGYYRLGLTPEEIKRELPHLSLAQVFDALAFYFDHKKEIDREMEHDLEEVVSRKYPPGKY